MRVLVDGQGTVLEREVIIGGLAGDIADDYDLADEFAVCCDDGQCFLIRTWRVEVESVHDMPQWVM